MEGVDEVVSAFAKVRHQVVLVVEDDKTELGEELRVVLAELVDDGAKVRLECEDVLE